VPDTILEHTDLEGFLDDGVLNHLHKACLMVLEHRPANPLVHLAGYFENVVEPQPSTKRAVQALSLTRNDAKAFMDQVASAYEHLAGANEDGPNQGSVTWSQVHDLLQQLQFLGLSCSKEVFEPEPSGHVPFSVFANVVSANLRAVGAPADCPRELNRQPFEDAAVAPAKCAVACSDGINGDSLRSLLLPSMLMQGVAVCAVPRVSKFGHEGATVTQRTVAGQKCNLKSLACWGHQAAENVGALGGCGEAPVTEVGTLERKEKDVAHATDSTADCTAVASDAGIRTHKDVQACTNTDVEASTHVPADKVAVSGAAEAPRAQGGCVRAESLNHVTTC
jgi:hypothetical protein